jgi:hypothetical protein
LQLLDVGQLDKPGVNSMALNTESPANDKWLGAKKMGISRTHDTWKNPRTIGNDFSLPNVPGGNVRFLLSDILYVKWRGYGARIAQSV